MKTAPVLEEEDQQQLIDTIRDSDLRIYTTKGRVKMLKERLGEIMEGHTAYAEMVKARDEFSRSKELLRLALQGDSEYNNLMEELAEENLALKDDKDILSLHIVEYYSQTHERQLELDDTGEARDVVVTGKLGKRAKYQTNLFSNNERQE